MPYNVFILPKIQIGNLKNRTPNRISSLLKDYGEKAMVITLNDNFPQEVFYPKTQFIKRGKVPDTFILNKIENGGFTLVVLYDCFFEYSGSFLEEIFKLTEKRDNLLLINVLPIVSAVVSKELFRGELAERIEYPDWERDDLQICLSFQSKTYMYEYSQLLPILQPTEEKTYSVSKAEHYKREFHFYKLLKKHIQCPTDLEVFSLFLNELYQELQQGNSSENQSLLEHMLKWTNQTNISYRYLKYTEKIIGVEYVENIAKNVRNIIQINPQIIDKISDFFVEYNRV